MATEPTPSGNQQNPLPMNTTSSQPSPAMQPPQPVFEKKEGYSSVSGVFKKILHGIFWPVTVLVKPLIFRVGGERGNPKVHFTSFSTLIYLWPIMVVGYLNSWLLHWNVASAATLGWVWITAVLIVLMCIGTDANRNRTIIVLLVGVLLWISGLLLEAKKGIPILSNIHQFFVEQNVQFDPGTAKVFSIITFIVLVCVVLGAWFDGRYEITTREITHKRIFQTSDSLPLAAKRIKRDWRDWTEALLGLGAGDLIVIDYNKNILMRIPNIPFLWFFRNDVDHILEVLATTEVDEAAAIEHADLA